MGKKAAVSVPPRVINHFQRQVNTLKRAFGQALKSIVIQDLPGQACEGLNCSQQIYVV